MGASSLAVVTCGSVVKLLNTRHNVRLHSHDVRYGSGNAGDRARVGSGGLGVSGGAGPKENLRVWSGKVRCSLGRFLRSG